MTETPNDAQQAARDIRVVIQAFAMQALIACGMIPDPSSGQTSPDSQMAAFHIGLLEVLQDKTKGNLTDEEAQYLEAILHEVRMAYVQMDKTPTEPSSAPAEEPSQD